MQEQQQYQVTVAFDAPCYATIEIAASSDDAAIEQVKEQFALGELFHKRALDPDFSLVDRHRVVSVVSPAGEDILADYHGEAVPATVEPQFSLLGQAHDVLKLLQAAIAVLPLLPDGEVKAELVERIRAFESAAVVTSWGIEDVRSVRPDMDESEARKVLNGLIRDYECSDADWDALSGQAETVRPKPDFDGLGLTVWGFQQTETDQAPEFYVAARTIDEARAKAQEAFSKVGPVEVEYGDFDSGEWADELSEGSLILAIPHPADVPAVDLVAVAEWVGLHYKVNFDAEPESRRETWIRRFVEAHQE